MSVDEAVDAADALLVGKGYDSAKRAILPPSPETRNRFVTRIYTTKGWMYHRHMGADSYAETIDAWSSRYEPNQ